jgi:hypothetical protein
LQADKAEKRSIASMQFNLADAQRKERMGMSREAILAADQARKDKMDSNRANIEKQKALGIMAGRGMVATRPLAGRGGAGGVKVPEQLAAAEIAFRQNPTPENERIVMGLRATQVQLNAKSSNTLSDVPVGGPKEQALINVDRAKLDTLIAGQRAKLAKLVASFMESSEYSRAKVAGTAKTVLDAYRTQQEDLLGLGALEGRETPVPVIAGSKPPPPTGYKLSVPK